MSIEKMLKTIRVNCGETQKAMAEKMGVYPSILCNIENGKVAMPIEILRGLFQNYDLSDEDKSELKRIFIETNESVNVKISDLDDSRKAEILDLALGQVL